MNILERQRKNGGYSLIEVIASVAILAIITGVLFSYFQLSSNSNREARVEEEALVLGKSTMEQCKRSTLDSIKNMYADVNYTEAGKNYTYKFENVAGGNGNRYDVLVNVDADTTYAAINSKKLVNLEPINSPYSMASAETIQNSLAISYFQQENTDYINARNEVEGTSLVPASEQDIKDNMERVMVINFQKIPGDNTNAKVDVYYKYFCYGVDGIHEVDEDSAKTIPLSLFSGNIEMANLKKCYLFFNPTNDIILHEKLVVNVEDSIQAEMHKLNIYLFCQEKDDGVIPSVDLDIKAPDGYTQDNIYTNLTGSVKIGSENVLPKEMMEESEEAQTQLSDLHVQIFRAGKHFDLASRLVNLDSTKGE